MQNRAGASSSTFGGALTSAAGALGPGARGSSALTSHHSQQSCETLSKKIQNKAHHKKPQFKSMNPYDLNVQMGN